MEKTKIQKILKYLNINEKDINIYFVDKFTYPNEYLQNFIPSVFNNGYFIDKCHLNYLHKCSGIKKVKLPAIFIKKGLSSNKTKFALLHELSHYLQIKKEGNWRKLEEFCADKDAKKWIKIMGE